MRGRWSLGARWCGWMNCCARPWPTPRTSSQSGVTATLGVCDPVTILGDRHRLRQLLLNLCDNAVKYDEPEGKVTLDLRRAGPRAEVRIGNTGRGIAAEVLPRVFDRFFRGDASHSQAVRGLRPGPEHRALDCERAWRHKMPIASETRQANDGHRAVAGGGVPLPKPTSPLTKTSPTSHGRVTFCGETAPSRVSSGGPRRKQIVYENEAESGLCSGRGNGRGAVRRLFQPGARIAPGAACRCGPPLVRARSSRTLPHFATLHALRSHSHERGWM